MPAFIRSSNVYKKSSLYSKISGIYKSDYQAYTKRSGVWKPVWSYAWETGSWGSCSKTCGGGVQKRTARCKRSDGAYVADNNCTKFGIAKPTVSQSCNTHSCETYSWLVLSWQGCDSGCTGVGTDQRFVECHRDSDFAYVDDSYCSGTKPAETRSCKECTDCSFNHNAYLEAKVKHCNAIRFLGRSNWTTDQVYANILRSHPNTRAHYDQYHVSESVCGYSSIYCCQQEGYRYYCKSWR